MKIIFMGTPKFAVPSLDILIQNNYDVAAVVTVPDKKKGRGQHVSYSDVKSYALEKNLPLLQPRTLKDEFFIQQIRDINPELIVVVAFRILPREVFTIPELGSINLHASLLPKYRGAAPINHAIINGDRETGVTTFFLREKVDTGNIILQEKINIELSDNAGTLHDKLSVLGSKILLQTIKLIEEGKAVEQIQDNSLASPAPKIFKEHMLINWCFPAMKIHNLIRGLSPYPAAYTLMNNKVIKIFESEMTEITSDVSPGKIKFENKKMYAGTDDKLLEIKVLQPEGKKRMSAADFQNGVSDKDNLSFKV